MSKELKKYLLKALIFKFCLERHFFKDNFLKLCRQFNIKDQIVFFPELINHTDNYNYVGPKLPFSEYILYGTRLMK
jgi:hypothetical protein